MTAIETYEQDGWTCKIVHDEDAESPDSWDNLGTLHHATDYTFGESQSRRNLENRRDGAYIRAIGIFGDDVAGVLPVYIAEHGPQLSCWETDVENANACLVTTHARLTELCGDDPKYHAHPWVMDALRGELAVWRQYLEGDVYGYVIESPTGEHIDSLWGMYGFDYAESEGREALACAIQDEAATVQAVARIIAI